MSSNPDSPAAAGEGSARAAGTALLGLVAARVELLGVEVREEALRLQRMLVLGVVAAFLFGSALVVAGVLIAVAFWETHRLAALAAVAALYAIGGAACVMRLRATMVHGPAPFDATVREFAADLRALRDPAGEPGP